jgi:hypothetical protein
LAPISGEIGAKVVAQPGREILAPLAEDPIPTGIPRPNLAGFEGLDRDYRADRPVELQPHLLIGIDDVCLAILGVRKNPPPPPVKALIAVLLEGMVSTARL